MQEAKLAEEQAHNPYSFDGRDLPTELEELRVCVAGVEDERTAEAGELAVLVVATSNALVDLRMLPIQEVPQLPNTAQEVLKAVVSSWSTCERCAPPTLVPGTRRWSATIPVARAILLAIFGLFLFFCIDINTYIY
jgi:hypothetical protein